MDKVKPMSEKITKYMRIYTRHDYDLMMYYLSLCSCKEAGNREFSRIIKIILRDYVDGTKTEIPSVVKNVNIIPQGSVRIRFTFDSKKDSEIIQLYKRIRSRQANSFLKNLLRSRLAEKQLSCYLCDTEVAFPAIIEGLEKRKCISSNKRNDSNSEPAMHDINSKKTEPYKAIEEMINVQPANESVIEENLIKENVNGLPKDDSNMIIPDAAPTTSGFDIFGALEKAMDFN